MNIRRFLLEKKYQLRGETNRTPPYSYTKLCKELVNIKELNSLTLSQHSEEKNINKKRLLIRHDIDHDPWTAEKMAVIESKYNLRATYFVLHTAPYFKNKFKETMEICRNIQSLEHEIGLHNDLITDFFMNNLDPGGNLAELLKLFKEEGITISGTASHGSPIIQKLNKTLNINTFLPYTNNLVFSELIEDALVKSPGKRQPPDPKFKNGELNLPCLNMNEFGLKYESYFVHFDHYVSDTSRRFWSTGDDPIATLKKMEKSGTLQCLFHPIWWKYYLS